MSTLSEIITERLLGNEIRIKDSHDPNEWFLVVNVQEPDNSDGYNGSYSQQFRLQLKDAYQEFVTINMSSEIEVRRPTKRAPDTGGQW